MSRHLGLLQLTLMTSEERALVEFLNEFNGATGHRFGERQEILLMFYLQRSRFQDAVNLSQRLDAAGVGGEKARHTRKAIMSRYKILISLNYIEHNGLWDTLCWKCCFSMEMLHTQKYDIPLVRVDHG